MDLHRRNTTQSRWRVWLTHQNEEEDFSDPIQELSGDELRPEEISDLHDSVDKVNLVIQRLSPRQRQAFLLRAWQGMDVAETAHIMKCSQGSVKTHYFRAINFLREHLQDQL